MNEERFTMLDERFTSLTSEEKKALIDEAEAYKNKVFIGEIHPCTSNVKLPTLILFCGKA